MGKFVYNLCRFSACRRWTVSRRVRFQHHDAKNDPAKKIVNPLQKVVKHHAFDASKLNESRIAQRICITVLGNGAVGQPRCLCVFTEFKCYMFNCGEGSLRIAKDHGVKSINARHVFITEAMWENVSGLPDIYLTHSYLGLRKITIHGPPNVENFLHVVKNHEKRVILSKKSVEDSPYADETIKVESVPFDVMKYEHQKKPFRSYSREKVVDQVVSYICKIKPRPGDFSTEKCMERGVPLGPLLLQLKQGEDISLPSGELVRSEEVHENHQEGSTFLVVDCPYEQLVQKFASDEKLHLKDAFAVFHFSPPHIINSYIYQKWMRNFPHSTMHIIINSKNSPLSSEAVHEIQHVLHMFHPSIFPLLRERHQVLEEQQEANVIQADARLQFLVRPRRMLDRSNVVNITPASYIQRAHELPGFSESLAQMHQDIFAEEKSTLKVSGKHLDDYPKVIFLGTSSSTSATYRNVTAILVYIDKNTSILLDCGEGTYVQLTRHFGPDKICVELQKISCIFISHHHADHYMGLFHLVRSRKEAFLSDSKPYKPVSVVTSSVVRKLIRSFDQVIHPFTQDIRLIMSHQLTKDSCFAHHLKEVLNSVELQPVPVIHCAESYGVVLRGPNWKIVYSGDACPSKALIDEGQNCNLLIHEASIEDNLHTEAFQKKHSTPAEVSDVAKRMNAEYTIMTHFSKRYLAVPVFAQSNDVGCAFDNMVVRLRDLPLLPLFVPTLKILFSDLLLEYTKKSSPAASFDRLFLKTYHNSNRA